MQPCGNCGKDVPQQQGKRRKEYCNDVCRQLAYRKRKHPERKPAQQEQADQGQKHTYAEMLTELVELREKVHDQEQDLAYLRNQRQGFLNNLEGRDDQINNQMQTIVELKRQVKEQEQEITHLKHLLDVEVWYHLDTEARGLKAWLKKQRATPLIEKLLADQFLPPGRKSRAFYERYFISKDYTPDEQAEFAHLWKAMLLQS